MTTYATAVHPFAPNTLRLREHLAQAFTNGALLGLRLRCSLRSQRFVGAEVLVEESTGRRWSPLSRHPDLRALLVGETGSRLRPFFPGSPLDTHPATLSLAKRSWYHLTHNEDDMDLTILPSGMWVALSDADTLLERELRDAHNPYGRPLPIGALTTFLVPLLPDSAHARLALRTHLEPLWAAWQDTPPPTGLEALHSLALTPPWD